MAFFSIIIPIYNVEKYLPDCLDSIIRQSFTDWEIIAVNDGSTDKSGEILDEYAANDCRFIIVHQENMRQLKTRRVALSLASGKYALFVDADDMIVSGMLDELYSIIQKTAFDMVFFTFFFLHDDGRYEKYNPVFPNGTVFTEKNKEKLLGAIISRKFPSLCLKATRMDVIRSDNTDYSQYTEGNISEDSLQLLPWVDASKTILYVDIPWYVYRIHNESITHRFVDNALKSYITTETAIFQYMEKWGMEDAETLSLFYQDILGWCVNFSYTPFLYTATKHQRKTALYEIANEELFLEALHYNRHMKGSIGSRITLYLLARKKLTILYFWNTVWANAVFFRFRVMLRKLMNTTLQKGEKK